MASTRELSPLAMLRPKDDLVLGLPLQTVYLDCNLRLHLQTAVLLRLHWAPVSSCLIVLSLPSLITPVSTSLVLGLRCGISSSGITFV